jgi:hypothetical protein
VYQQGPSGRGEQRKPDGRCQQGAAVFGLHVLPCLLLVVESQLLQFALHTIVMFVVKRASMQRAAICSHEQPAG